MTTQGEQLDATVVALRDEINIQGRQIADLRQTLDTIRGARDADVVELKRRVAQFTDEREAADLSRVRLAEDLGRRIDDAMRQIGNMSEQVDEMRLNRDADAETLLKHAGVITGLKSRVDQCAVASRVDSLLGELRGQVSTMSGSLSRAWQAIEAHDHPPRWRRYARLPRLLTGRWEQTRSLCTVTRAALVSVSLCGVAVLILAGVALGQIDAVAEFLQVAGN